MAKCTSATLLAPLALDSFFRAAYNLSAFVSTTNKGQPQRSFLHSTSAAPSQSPSKGLALLAAASVSFALMGAITHAVHLPFWELSLARGVVISSLLLPVILHKKIPLGGTNKGWLLLRGLAGTASLVAYFYALQTIPLSEASLLTFSSPVWVALFAPFLLGELVRIERLAAVAVGLLGLLLVLGPDTFLGGSDATLFWGRLAGLFSGICSAFAYMVVRKLRSDNALVVVFHFSLISILICAPGTVIEGQWPSGLEWLGILGLGALAALGQYLMTLGYQRVEASAGSTMNLLNPVLSQFLSFFLFAEPFGGLQLIGSFLVFGAAVYLSRVEAKRR